MFCFCCLWEFVCFYPVIFSCFFSNLFFRERVLYWILYIYSFNSLLSTITRTMATSQNNNNNINTSSNNTIKFSAVDFQRWNQTTRYRIEYCYSSDRHASDINGIAFRGIQLTPLSAYEEVKSVFVDRAPLQMQNQHLFDTLAPYGWVISVQHLKVKGFPSL